jgi:hypothetical protein
MLKLSAKRGLVSCPPRHVRELFPQICNPARADWPKLGHSAGTECQPNCAKSLSLNLACTLTQ